MAEKGKAKQAGISLSDLKKEEVEGLVAGLANQGMTPSEIGMALRDQHGIPSIKKLTGMNLEQILEKKGIKGDMPRDMLNLIKLSVVQYRHMQKNKKDMTAKRGYMLTVSKIRRLTDYYIKKVKLAKGWRYTPETAALLVK